MSIKNFIKNMYFLWKYDVKKDIYKVDNYDLIIEQAAYESTCISKPVINNYEETIEKLVNTDFSIVRFGDGEISIIEGQNIPFQNYDENLAKRLKEALQCENSKLLVAINYEYYYPKIDKLLPFVAEFYRNSVPLLRRKLSNYIDFDKQYYAAAFTQLFMFYQKYNFDEHYNKLRKIWNNKKILIVTCQDMLKNIQYNIFDNAAQIDYLNIPSKHAFTEYDKIYSSILEYPNDTIIVPMAGPTAKVLIIDLLKEDYRALDLGHLMKDYDWYRKNKERTAKNIIEFMSPD